MVYLGLKVRGFAVGSVLLVVWLCFLPCFCLRTNAQQDYSIQTRGYARPHSSIKVCIVSQENQTWWKPEYLDAALQGVAMWNDAIEDFSLKYPQFGYLSGLGFVATVTAEPVSGFDVYMGWIQECEIEATIGQTTVTINGSCTILNSTVCLAGKAPSGHVMNEVDMQNIVVHELGHNLGLSHTSYDEDAMHEIVEYRETVKPLSTLDVYAVSQNFAWMTNSTQANSNNMCLEQSALNLPANIPYEHLPVADENIPVFVPQSFFEVVEQFLRPETLVLVSFGAVLVFVFSVLFKKRKKGSH